MGSFFGNMLGTNKRDHTSTLNGFLVRTILIADYIARTLTCFDGQAPVTSIGIESQLSMHLQHSTVLPLIKKSTGSPNYIAPSYDGILVFLTREEEVLNSKPKAPKPQP